MATYAVHGDDDTLRLEDMFDGPKLLLDGERPARRLTFAGGEVDLTAFDTQLVSSSASQ